MNENEGLCKSPKVPSAVKGNPTIIHIQPYCLWCEKNFNNVWEMPGEIHSWADDNSKNICISKSIVLASNSG